MVVLDNVQLMHAPKVNSSYFSQFTSRPDAPISDVWIPFNPSPTTSSSSSPTITVDMCSRACLSDARCTAFEHQRDGKGKAHAVMDESAKGGGMGRSGGDTKIQNGATCLLYVDDYDDYDAPLQRRVQDDERVVTVQYTSGVKSCVTASHVPFDSVYGGGAGGQSYESSTSSSGGNESMATAAMCRVSPAALRLAQASPWSDVTLWRLPGRDTSPTAAAAAAKKLLHCLHGPVPPGKSQQPQQQQRIFWASSVAAYAASTDEDEDGGDDERINSTQEPRQRKDDAWNAWMGVIKGNVETINNEMTGERPRAEVGGAPRKSHTAMGGVDCRVVERLNTLGTKITQLRKGENTDENGSTSTSPTPPLERNYAVSVGSDAKLVSLWPSFGPHSPAQNNKTAKSKATTEALTGEKMANKKALKVIALMDGHDCCLTIALGGNVKVSLELERLTGLRYVR